MNAVVSIVAVAATLVVVGAVVAARIVLSALAEIDLELREQDDDEDGVRPGCPDAVVTLRRVGRR